MSDILITLQTERRSGILAGAVASLHRNGLLFRSQRMGDGADASLLILEAEGDLVEAEPLIDALRSMRGISDVRELVIDGRSFFDQAPESEAPAASAPHPPAEYVATRPATAGSPSPLPTHGQSAPAAQPVPAAPAAGQTGDEHVTLVELTDDDDDLFPAAEPPAAPAPPAVQQAVGAPGVQHEADADPPPLPAAAARRRRYNR